jgi:lysine-N-methylase
VVVGLRFSCPSVAANRGQPLLEQKTEIQKLAECVALDHFREIPPPAVLAGPGTEWPDLLRFVKWLDTSMAVKETPLTLKFLRTLHWLGAVEKGSFSQISGPGADEILEALFQGAEKKLPVLPESPARPGSFSRLFFRMLVLEYARMITMEDLRAPGRHRWQMLRAAWRFVRGGRTPALREGLEPVEFAAIEQRFEPLSPAIEAMLTRFFRVKIQSLHFCGRAFYDRPLIEGFRNLALLYPVILWLGRWQAAGQQRTNLTEADAARAMSMVDYHYSYSPYLAWRVRLLAQCDDIARLCAWYGR